MTEQQKPKPSVLYHDDTDGEPILLTGELSGMMDRATGQLLALTMEWSGLLAELRPAEHARLEPLISSLRGHMLEGWQLIDKIGAEMERIGDDRRAREAKRRGEDEGLDELLERESAERAVRRAVELAFEQAGFEGFADYVESITQSALADAEGG